MPYIGSSTAAISRYARYVGFRPIASAMKPNVTYPNHMPTCIAITNSDIVDDERPMPP